MAIVTSDVFSLNFLSEFVNCFAFIYGKMSGSVIKFSYL